MSILSAEHVSYSFGGRKILEDATFRLLRGEHIGLIGANGEGKTTFLNIITGKLTPDEGKIQWCKHITTGYLDQHTALEKGKSIRQVLQGAFDEMFALEKQMLAMYEQMESADDQTLAELMEEVGEIQTCLEESGFYTIDTKIEEIANGLGLKDIGLERHVDQLSGGQRTKVLLTKLLLQNPMILILDEPTNFLDENHIKWLENFLNNYEHAFILVSHSIPFLNNVVNVIYHMEDAILTRYSGGYRQFEQMYELKKRQQQQAYEKQQKEISQLETFIAKNKARVATTNMAKSRQKKLDKMDKITLAKEKPKPVFSFLEAKSPGKLVVQAKDLVLGYEQPFTRPLQLELERGKKIAVKGVNGLGKSTLLKTILGIISPYSGSCMLDEQAQPAYFEQEHVGGENTALEEIWQYYPGMSNAEVRAALARCGLSNEHITTQVRVLSGGENAKVRLCKLMLSPANFLVLDEPTNHLDAEAKQALQLALAAFKGTILLVSHEPEFYQNIIDDIWNIEAWTTKII